MPKHRRRIKQPGAKSVGIRTKNKIGGRKSGRSPKQLSNFELLEITGKVRKRDKNKLLRTLEDRGLIKIK